MAKGVTIRRGTSRALAEKGREVAVLAPHEARDLKLRQASRNLQAAYLDTIAVAWESVEAKDHERFGFADPVAYLEDRLQLAYRSVKRLLAVWAAVLRVPEVEHPALRAALAELGSHKAGVLAPVLGLDGDWQGWVDRAKPMTEEALQEVVNQATGKGRTRAGDPPEPGDRFYRYLLQSVPPDTHEEVEEVFEMGFRLAQSRNPVAVFLALVREAKVEWASRLTHSVE